MAAINFPADAFEPVTAARQVHEISRPSLSYWQDAWQRLKRNQRALFSLYIIIGLLVFTALGPLVWRVDPADQDVDQRSQSPFADRTAIVVPPFQPWDGATANVAAATEPMSLQLAEPANTEAVRLIWTPDPYAAGYRVYRNILKPGPQRDLGVPLGEVYGADHVSFEDRLNLEAKRYFYAVVPFDAADTDRPNDARLAVDVKRVITAQIATTRG